MFFSIHACTTPHVFNQHYSVHSPRVTKGKGVGIVFGNDKQSPIKHFAVAHLPPWKDPHNEAINNFPEVNDKEHGRERPEYDITSVPS